MTKPHEGCIRAVVEALREGCNDWSRAHPNDKWNGESRLQRAAIRLEKHLPPTPPEPSEEKISAEEWEKAAATISKTHFAVCRFYETAEDRAYAEAVHYCRVRADIARSQAQAAKAAEAFHPDRLASKPAVVEGGVKDGKHDWATCEWAQAWSAVCKVVPQREVDYETDGLTGQQRIVGAVERAFAERDAANARAEKAEAALRMTRATVSAYRDASLSEPCPSLLGGPAYQRWLREHFDVIRLAEALTASAEDKA